MSGPMQTPPGFNQHPQNVPPGYGQGPRPMQQPYPQQMPQQYAQPGYPQYGPPGYYPPPQKSGIPGWVIGVIVAVIVLPFVLGILALAAIPLIASNTDEARSSEARAALGAMKDRARVVYQRNPSLRSIEKGDLELQPYELDGTYFKDSNYSCGGPATYWRAVCTGVYSKGSPRDLEITANLMTGVGNFNR